MGKITGKKITGKFNSAEKKNYGKIQLAWGEKIMKKIPLP